MPYASASEIRRGVSEMFRPPDSISVSDGIAKTLVMPTGPYDPLLTPYMSEPADKLASRRYRVVVFIGPGRTGKTVTLIDGWICYVVRYAPGDMLVVQSSQDLARYHSKMRLKREIEASPEIRDRQSPRRQDDNTFDKVFRSGMVLAFGWPSAAQLSGRDFRYVAVTEYDACADDIDDEGSLYSLASKRTETFMSAGKTLIETSVRREYRDAKWKRSAGSKHEAPPATGATALYNMGTRCWYYWRCPDCRAWFALDPDVHEMFNLPPLPELAEQLTGVDPGEWANAHAVLGCPHCGSVINERDKRELNIAGRWVPDGCTISGDGVISGATRATDIASYQISCIAAAYNSWAKILAKYALAIVEFTRTGDETEIKSTVNLDQGRAYLPIAAQRTRRDDHALQERSEDWEHGVVPEGVRFLTASVDIQAGKVPRFVVQVMGWGVGMEAWIVDRFALKSSERPDGDGGYLPIDPAKYLEDWDRLIEKVIDRRYPLAGNPSRSMPVRITVCDSGGEEGVTEKAYSFWRSLREKRMAHRFRLVKGAERDNGRRVEETFPDTRKRSDRNAGAAGDVPVLSINVTMIKDTISHNIVREHPGPGYYHFPRWLPTSFFEELTAEHRGPKRWERQGNAPNESFDLCVYGHAACIHIGADKFNWSAPPAWADTWSKNPDLGPISNPEPPRPLRPRRGNRSSGVSPY